MSRYVFENMPLWQKAIDLSCGISSLVKSFPQDEIFVMTSQIKRASDSVSLHIAESVMRKEEKDSCKFLSYAVQSVIEVIACLHITFRRSLISQNDFDFYTTLCDEITSMIDEIKKANCTRNNL